MGLRERYLNVKSRECWLFVALLVFCISCGRSPQSRVFLLDESRSVAGSLIGKNGFDPKNVSFSLINPQGFRESPDSLTFDSATNKFSLNLPDGKFYGTQNATIVEQILSMGKALPTIGFSSDSIVGKVEKYVRLEVMPAKLGTERFQKVPYLQIAIPLTRRNLYSGNDVLELGGGLELSSGGFVKVQVLSESGTPVAGADVAAVTDGKLVFGGDTLPIWHDQMWRPVFVKTDAAGVAYIGPVDPSDLQPFQILAKKEGYCYFLSSPSGNRFSLSETKDVSIKIRECRPETSATNTLLPSFPTGLKYLQSSDSGAARQVVYTNESSLFLRLDATTEKLRGVTIAVFETDDKFTPKKPFGEVREVPHYQGEFEVSLPKLFDKTVLPEDGNFLVRIGRIAGTLDGPALSAEAYPEVVIYGSKSTKKPSRDSLFLMKALSYDEDKTYDPETFLYYSNPSEMIKDEGIDYWQNFAIRSVGGFENIVPGTSGGTFTLSSRDCKTGYELGFQVSRLEIPKIYKPCVVGSDGIGVATFTADEVGFVSKLEKIKTEGARQSWTIYMKDQHGNEIEQLQSSTDPEKTLSIMTVVIDAAIPRLGEDAHPLANLEFVDTEGGTNLTQIKRDDFTSGKLRFRFKNESESAEDLICSQKNVDDSQYETLLNGGGSGYNATIKRGISDYLVKDDLSRVWGLSSSNEQRPGLQFVKYALAATESALAGKAVSQFTPCRALVPDGGEKRLKAVETVLTAEHITFPEDSTQSAKFYLRVMDGAGQLSAVTLYEIPACILTGTNPVTSGCWKPN